MHTGFHFAARQKYLAAACTDLTQGHPDAHLSLQVNPRRAYWRDSNAHPLH